MVRDSGVLCFTKFGSFAHSVDWKVVLTFLSSQNDGIKKGWTPYLEDTVLPVDFKNHKSNIYKRTYVKDFLYALINEGTDGCYNVFKKD